MDGNAKVLNFFVERENGWVAPWIRRRARVEVIAATIKALQMFLRDNYGRAKGNKPRSRANILAY